MLADRGELKLESAHSDVIHFVIWTNTFSNLHKYIQQFAQMHSAICTNTFSNLHKYIDKFGQIYLEIVKEHLAILTNILAIFTNTFSKLAESGQREKARNRLKFQLQPCRN